MAVCGLGVFFVPPSAGVAHTPASTPAPAAKQLQPSEPTSPRVSSSPFDHDPHPEEVPTTGAPQELSVDSQADDSAPLASSGPPGGRAVQTEPEEVPTERASVAVVTRDALVSIPPKSANQAGSEAAEPPREKASASLRTFRFIAPAQSQGTGESSEPQTFTQTQPEDPESRPAALAGDPVSQPDAASATPLVSAEPFSEADPGDAGPTPEVPPDAERASENPLYSATTEVDSDSGADPETDEEQPPNPVIPADRFIQWFNIGFSANDPANRMVGRGLPRSSWETFVRLSVKPVSRRGVRRFELHNPFGALNGEVMQLDQFLHAKDARLDFLTEGFVEAWKPITDSGIEVIGYVGCGTQDPDFDDLAPAAWQARALASVQPLLDAGMSIGLDAAVNEPAESQTFEFASRLRQMGTRVYVEAKPTRFTPHWFDFDVIAVDRAWLMADLERGHPQAQNYGIDNDRLLGESVRIISPRLPDETWDDLKGQAYLDRVNEILSEGQSVMGGTSGLFEMRPEVIFQSGLKELPASYD